MAEAQEDEAPGSGCPSSHRGAACGKGEGVHRLHEGRDATGKLRMWDDNVGYIKGPPRRPKVGDNLDDFPEYRGPSRADATYM